MPFKSKRPIDWGHVQRDVVPKSHGEEEPEEHPAWFDLAKFRCPKCRGWMDFYKHWLEGTHYVLRYWRCKKCPYEYATHELATLTTGDYLGLGY